MKLVTSKEMRRIEQLAVDSGVSLDELMHNAARHVAQRAANLQNGPILILAGRGNNGGDGIVAARMLRESGHVVHLFTVGTPAETQRESATRAEDDHGLRTLRRLLGETSVIVDALLGTGQNRPLHGLMRDVVVSVNTYAASQARVIAVDIPTGVIADTGQLSGDAIRCDLTLGLGLVKLGTILYPGATYAGQVVACDIGLPANAGADIQLETTESGDVAPLLPFRSPEANKGSSGRLLIVGGCRRYPGAPGLAASAAYRAGAGLVEVAVPESIVATVAANAREPVFLPLPEQDGTVSASAGTVIADALNDCKALTFGSGLGPSSASVEVTRSVLHKLSGLGSPPAIVDADGLNALSRIEHWWAPTRNLVLTPHPGEMARLTGLSIGEVQADRVEVAREHSRKWGAVVVLKGARTVVASPDGQCSINLSGSTNLATAGTGDVLAGMIGALLAQGCAPYSAARAGTFWHGMAGDLLRESQGDVGTVAGDLPNMLPRARLQILGTSQETP